MSSSASAILFYGIQLSEEELYKHFKLDPEGRDPYSKVEGIIANAGFRLVSAGNFVLGDLTYGISLKEIECGEEVAEISLEEMYIDLRQAETLKKFLSKHKFSTNLCWHIGASYG